MRTSTLLAFLLLLLTTSCYGTRKITDPTLLIQGDQGTELGVSTNYGVVFLGRQARSGYVEVTSWFGDGPSVESSVAEPIGGGLFTAETEIRLPSVPIRFETPVPGSVVEVIGRDGETKWSTEATVIEDPSIYGMLLEPSKTLQLRADQVGAGVFVGELAEKQLLGLVSGRIRIVSEDGSSREYLTVVDSEELWRLVTYRRDHGRRRPFVYRQDIL